MKTEDILLNESIDDFDAHERLAQLQRIVNEWIFSTRMESNIKRLGRLKAEHFMDAGDELEELIKELQ
jgi:hypothetical protein